MASPTYVVRGTAVSVATLLAATLLGGPVVGQEEWPGPDAVVLEQARTGHTATLLPDDYVLLAGGTDGVAELAGVEVVDPVGMAVEVLGALTVARTEHTATTLQDGRILIAGGRAQGASLADAELFDPLSGESEPTGPLVAARAEHDAVMLQDGRVLLVGGVDGEGMVATAELYDPETGTFAETAPPSASHLGAAAVGLADGRVLLTGDVPKAMKMPDKKTKKKKTKSKKARSKKTPAAPTAEIYDPGTEQWAPVPGGGKLVGHAARSLPDGRVLLVGGSDPTAELFDPEAGTFAATGVMAAPRTGHTLSALIDGRILVVGGADTGFELPVLEVYDPAAGSFEIAGELLVPRAGHTSTTLSDGRVLITGGSFAGLMLDDLLVYEPRSASLLPLSIDMELTEDADAEVADSRTRGDIRAQYGSPDAFTVYYYDETADDGSVGGTSLEEWRYHDAGLEFTFAGDALAAEDPIVPPAAIVEPAPYDPDQFHAYMSLDEVLAATAIEEYIGGPTDDALSDGAVYLGPRLAWGMQDGELRYIEAFALEAEGVSEEVE